MSSNPQLQHEALSRARGGISMANYASIIEGFTRKGIPAAEILPRENVFTYNAWKALGRQVRKGEKGVRCLTFIDAKDKTTGQSKRRPWHTTVFHVSQTDVVGSNPTSPNNLANRYMGPVHHAPAPVLYPDAATDTPDAWRNEPVPLTAGHNLAEGAIDVEHDATGGNVEHAGETEPAAWDARVLALARVESRRLDRLRVEVLSAGKQADGDRFNAGQGIVEDDYTYVPPVRSAIERAEAGEPVNIMELIPERKPVTPQLPPPLAPSHYTRLRPSVSKKDVGVLAEPFLRRALVRRGDCSAISGTVASQGTVAEKVTPWNCFTQTSSGRHDRRMNASRPSSSYMPSVCAMPRTRPKNARHLATSRSRRSTKMCS